MTKKEAHAESHRRWGDPDAGPHARNGMVSLQRKTSPNRCHVGFYERGATPTDTGRSVTVGSGDTWEQAFADADQHPERAARAGKEV